MGGGVKLARIFEKTAYFWKGFPPDLVKTFDASMSEYAPEIEKIIIAGTRKAKKKAAAAR